MATGVVKKLTVEERSFYTAQDVMILLDVSRDKAYRMIRYMREDLINEGRLAKEYPQGKIPKRFFNEQCMIE